jgi:hypothetical protein
LLLHIAPILQHGTALLCSKPPAFIAKNPLEALKINILHLGVPSDITEVISLAQCLLSISMTPIVINYD